MSKSAAGFLGDGAVMGCDFANDFRMASGLALEGERFALIFEGERGMSGDTAFGGGAILIRSSSEGILCPGFEIGTNGFASLMWVVLGREDTVSAICLLTLEQIVRYSSE